MAHPSSTTASSKARYQGPMLFGTPIKIEQLHEAVAELAPETELCAVVIPVGLPVQVFYEKGRLSRVFLLDGSDQDITRYCSFIPTQLGQIRRKEFDICGRVWINEATFRLLNAERRRIQHPVYATPLQAIAAVFGGQATALLQFTPNWSYALLDGVEFTRYTGFIAAMEQNFRPSPIIYTATAATVENLIAFYNTQAGYQDDPAVIADLRAETFCVFRNALPEAPKSMLTPLELLLTHVAFANEDRMAVVDGITVECDRYGRLRTLATVHENNDAETTHTILLADSPIARQFSYTIGDQVELTGDRHTPQLGRILRSIAKGVAEDPRGVPEDNKFCGHCRDPLHRRGDQYYCYNDTCPSTTFYRLNYACSREVLAIPLDWQTLSSLVWQLEEDMPIPKLLSMERAHLEKYLTGEEAEAVLETLHQRRQVLRGLGSYDGQQTMARGRLLDALSLRGLYRRHIVTLLEGLDRRTWQWPDLANILTDARFLRNHPIPLADVRAILHHARQRGDELKACAEI